MFDKRDKQIDFFVTRHLYKLYASLLQLISLSSIILEATTAFRTNVQGNIYLMSGMIN